MDKDLAVAVFERWANGAPVYEGTFYKAAEALGIQPDAALAEARFYTNLDRFLLEKRAMTIYEKAYFATAAGWNPIEMVKTAGAHGFYDEELIVEALRENNFVPDLEKLALLGMQGGPAEGPSQDPSGGQGPNPSQDGPGASAAAPTEPQPGAQVQQAPAAREDGVPPGSPTAPESQLPSSPEGNFQQLLQGAQNADAASMGGEGGLPPAGMGAQETPPPPTAEEKLQQVFQGQLDPDTLARYAPQLEAFEKQMGMSIQDPKQIEKFVKELQKTDKKQIDEGIKQFAAQQQQASGGGGEGGQLDPTAPKPLSSPSSSDEAAAISKVAAVMRRMARGQG